MNERSALFISHANPEDNTFTLWLGAKLAALGYEVWADVMKISGGVDWQTLVQFQIPRESNDKNGIWRAIQLSHGQSV
jgi:hypothetical protein